MGERNKTHLTAKKNRTIGAFSQHCGAVYRHESCRCQSILPYLAIFCLLFHLFRFPFHIGTL
jgi:hypothetical protein